MKKIVLLPVYLVEWMLDFASQGKLQGSIMWFLVVLPLFSLVLYQIIFSAIEYISQSKMERKRKWRLLFAIYLCSHVLCCLFHTYPDFH